MELAIPFNQLRFQDAEGPQTWGIDGVRSYPRTQCHHIGLFPRLRGANSYLSQEEKIEGFDGVAPGRNLEFLPTVTATRTDERPAASDGPLERRSAGDVGLTARWGITPNVTADLAANPDFSQVEADAVQLDVNNQFALLFPETRPFFLEGADYFRLRRMNLVYTRTVADPVGALKTTGKHGRHTYGVFSARDARTNVLVPGSQRSDTERFDIRTTGTVSRYRMDFGRNSAVGASLTSREGDVYFNRVLAVDTRHRFGDADSVSLTVARSATRYDEAMRKRFDQSAGVLNGVAVEAHYQRTTRNWFASAGYGDYDEAFRADLGFVTQVGFRKWEAQVVRLWHGDGAFNQVGLGGSADYVEERNGGVLERGVVGSASYIGPRETFAFAAVDRRDRVFAGIEFPQLTVRANLQTRPHRDLLFTTRFEHGGQIDFAQARAGTEIRFQPAVTVNLGRRWLLQYTPPSICRRRGCSPPATAVSSCSSSSPTRSTRRPCSTSGTPTTTSEPITSGCCVRTARSSSRRATPGCCSSGASGRHSSPSQCCRRFDPRGPSRRQPHARRRDAARQQRDRDEPPAASGCRACRRPAVDTPGSSMLNL